MLCRVFLRCYCGIYGFVDCGFVPERTERVPPFFHPALYHPLGKCKEFFQVSSSLHTPPRTQRLVTFPEGNDLKQHASGANRGAEGYDSAVAVEAQLSEVLTRLSKTEEQNETMRGLMTKMEEERHQMLLEQYGGVAGGRGRTSAGGGN